MRLIKLFVEEGFIFNLNASIFTRGFIAKEAVCVYESDDGTMPWETEPGLFQSLIYIVKK